MKLELSENDVRALLDQIRVMERYEMDDEVSNPTPEWLQYSDHSTMADFWSAFEVVEQKLREFLLEVDGPDECPSISDIRERGYDEQERINRDLRWERGY